jgi:Type IIA topoisomerase (DNA gyrase/topo II, topoisomerase IV), A subunit
MSELNNIIKESFAQYAGMVIQSRALVDARDGLKPSARQIFYSMLLHKLTHNNPYKKTANAVGMAMADFYIHGDSSCEGIIMRAGQRFAMRYPLVDVKGNSGSLIESGNWAAMRYTESRLSALSNILFTDIDKDTITEWRDSYDNTKQYPAVLPSKGFYNLCNGTSGIAVGLASSIPQFNLKELNNALINLIQNPDCDFDDIYCAPDFATGAILLNADEVKESLRVGNGPACKLRSVVEFDAAERCFVVKEIPYSVYTNTICKQLEELIESEDNPGIERFNDLTGATPLIKIYLTKKANPDKVLKYLYKNTSLQYYYGINLTMLDGGKYPKVFTWREALQAHIDHEKVVYRRGFEHDLNKMKFRVHIIDGLLVCIARIEEVVEVVKTSSSTAEASARLQKEFLLDADQAKAVLELRLSRLAHLEVTKLYGEKNDLLEKISALEQILGDEILFNNELIKGWKDVAAKFGDARRTKILNISTESEEEPTEVRNLILSFTNKGGIFVTESSTLYSQRRGGVGTKLKLEKGEYVVGTEIGDTTDVALFFSNRGNFFQVKLSDLPINEKTYISQYVTTINNENICNAAIYAKNTNKNIYFVTRNGLLKKSLLSEYYLKRGNSARAINLEDNDSIVSVFFGNDDTDCGILSSDGNFIMVKTNDVAAVGRIAKGIKCMKLNAGAYVQGARPLSNETKTIISVTKKGLAKQTPISEFSYTNRNTKGSKLQGTVEGDEVVAFEGITNETDLIVTSNVSQIRFALTEVPTLSRSAQGVKTIKLNANEYVVGLEKI